VPVKDCQTEKLILDTAARVFFAEGRINATTQDIADNAGLSRTLIHYYFRSKKDLINSVVKSTMKQFKSKGDQILQSDLPFRQKTEKFIDDFLSNLTLYPYLESFMTTELIKESQKKSLKGKSREEQALPIQLYLKEIENEMEAGNIPQSHPVHFLMNMFSLMAYPILVKPLYMDLLDMNESEYMKILSQRKQVVMDNLFPSIKTNESENP